MKNPLATFVGRLRFLSRRQQISDEVTQELASHLDLLTSRYIESGLTPVEARRAATRQLGNITLVRENVYEMNSIRWLDTLAQDVSPRASRVRAGILHSPPW